MAGVMSPDRAGADSALPTWGASGNVTFHLDIRPGIPVGGFVQKRKWPATTSLLFHNARRGCGQRARRKEALPTEDPAFSSSSRTLKQPSY